MSEKTDPVQPRHSKDYYLGGIVAALAIRNFITLRNDPIGLLKFIDKQIVDFEKKKRLCKKIGPITLLNNGNEINVSSKYPLTGPQIKALFRAWDQFDEIPKFSTGTGRIESNDVVQSLSGYFEPNGKSRDGYKDLPRVQASLGPKSPIERLKSEWRFNIDNKTTYLSDIGIQAAIAEMGLKLNEIIDAINSQNQTDVKSVDENEELFPNEKSVNVHNIPMHKREFEKMTSGKYNSVKTPATWKYSIGDHVILVEFDVTPVTSSVVYSGNHLHKKIDAIMPKNKSYVDLILSEIE